MNRVTLSLMAATAIISTSIFAADTLEGAFKEGTVSGQVRAFYIHRDYTYAGATSGTPTSNTINDRDGLALGGKMAYETASLYGVSAGAAFYTTNKLDSASGTMTHNDKTLFDSTDKGFTYLGQAYLQGKLGKTLVKVGRQQLDTPLAGSDDARELPTLFTAALVVNNDVPDTTLIAARVTQVSYGTFASNYATTNATTGANRLALSSGYGLGDNSNNGKFQSMGSGALNGIVANTSDTGVTAVAVINKSIAGLTAQVWDYNAENILNAIYAQADYSWKCLLNPNATMTASAQYIKERNLASGVDLSSAPYYGVQLATKAGNFNASAAYSSTGTDNSATLNGNVISPWGGMPAFTAGMVARHQFFADTKAYKLSAGYNLKDVVGQDITASAYYCSFDVGSSVNGYTDKVTTTEPGFVITYNNAGIKNLQLKLRGNFPNDFKKSTTNAETTSWKEYRVIANYNF